MNKKEIRKQIKELRLGLSDSDKNIASHDVFNRLENHSEFIKAENILFYYSLPDELPTVNFIRKWSKSKNIYLPRVNGDDLDILAYDDSNLSIGSYDIEEPIGDELIDYNTIDLIIVPAVAFDYDKNRLGRGKGYYDRLLSKAVNAIKIGVGYDFQLVEKLPTEQHDIPMDYIITPNNIL